VLREYINRIRTDKKYASLQMWVISMFLFGCTVMAITAYSMGAMSDLAIYLLSNYDKYVQLVGVLLFGMFPPMLMLYLLEPLFMFAGLLFLKLFDEEEYNKTMARIQATKQNLVKI
jgi:hypothetical protein